MTVTAIDRTELVDWYRRNRRRSARLFNVILPEAYYDRPIPLRHPFVFYNGHLPAFSFNTLCARALQEPGIDERLQRLFERGIDPGSLDAAKAHDREDWPSAQRVAEFAARCDERVEAALARADIDRSGVPMLERGQAAFTILEHEMMHHETLLYIVHQLDASKKRPMLSEHRDSDLPVQTSRAVAAGTATLGVDARAVPFAWDNEIPEYAVHVAAFDIDAYPVTNARWLEFVEDGGPRPPFWIERNGEWLLRALFEDIALPKSWPVYVSHAQAAAYARWAGKRLPTEAEFHRAAFGSPSGEERAFPWGDAKPEPKHGNFDFCRYDPEPVDAHPAGASAWGVHDLIGNGWEWTATPFAPFPGFAPMASYPQYSADFFDGNHYVMKGASPVTAREFVRRSFRNWFYGDYPYMYAKFRCAG
ncbi:MAG: SUMF1/EgtB/PvdO family nonheme iron enzyme [Candidatus Eremiobacteraeota bacterium]|nr:SUMF1/EgtB/PvdO family nonheme iron enzyme [Candidatus Eremiobacteraeota bacterium]